MYESISIGGFITKEMARIQRPIEEQVDTENATDKTFSIHLTAGVSSFTILNYQAILIC